MIERTETNSKRSNRSPVVLGALASVLLLATYATDLQAGGVEILGPPSIDIENGSVITAYGAETINQPSFIDFEVPDGATIKQVLAYWAGEAREETLPGDDTILINGIEVTGALIGGPAFFYPLQGDPISHSSFRADITGLLDEYGFSVIDNGWNALTIEGMSFDPFNNGVGIVVIYDDGTPQAEIQIVDGIDLAYDGFPEPRQTTVPQTFNFEPAEMERTALLGLLVAAIDIPQPRDTTIEITIDGTVTRLENALTVSSWDSWQLPVQLPAGVSSLTVRILSGDQSAPIYNPDAFAWVAAFLSIPPASSAAPPDADGDGVLDEDDVCPDTTIVENVPTQRLGFFRYALLDDDTTFDTRTPAWYQRPRTTYTIEDTAGCSCEQIIDELGLGRFQRRFGCGYYVMRYWVRRVQR